MDVLKKFGHQSSAPPLRLDLFFFPIAFNPSWGPPEIEALNWEFSLSLTVCISVRASLVDRVDLLDYKLVSKSHSLSSRDSDKLG